MSLTLSQIARWSGGVLLQGRPSDRVETVSTDSRKVEPGQIFVALKGDRFDAHDFIGEVAGKGATALLVSDLKRETESYGGAVVRVDDTLGGLQRLAFHHRRNMPGLFVVGVTGSNGKTSTKDFISAALFAGGNVCKTDGNLNNHIGLPLTILSCSDQDHYGVWEMGMNHSGEIEVLADIAQPDAAVITHIGSAHIEHLGSREAIAEEKSQLAVAVPKSGYCVMPQTDDFYDFVSDRASCTMVPVGLEQGEVRAEEVSIVEGGRSRFLIASDFQERPEVVLPVQGRHMIVNALLAAAVALRQGISPEAIASKLSASTLTEGRLQERDIEGFRFLDDSYNANPDSMRAAVETLRDTRVAGKRIAVFGFMGELGEHELPEHQKLGASLEGYGVDVLVSV
ncbi:MAG: UDP-N-acetylmuramoyl-tripeptide--D-alanyl-D-alanine ligase, partial [Verrucomicrobiota bacterium]